MSPCRETFETGGLLFRALDTPNSVELGQRSFFAVLVVQPSPSQMSPQGTGVLACFTTRLALGLVCSRPFSPSVVLTVVACHGVRLIP